MSKMESEEIVAYGRSIVLAERDALSALAQSVGPSFAEAIALLLSMRGKAVLTGVGKSGAIAKKIAATLSSTGTPAIFLHPTDALHGDLGIVQKDDVLVALSKSGESDELRALLLAAKGLGAKVLLLSSRITSSMAKTADLSLIIEDVQEAGPHSLAPTSSAVATLAMGDALAMTLMKLKDFRPQDFAGYHPGGQLGRRLSLKVKDSMIGRAQLPCLAQNADMDEVLGACRHFGIVLVCDAHDRLEGILTDGDVRRLLQKHRSAFFSLKLQDVMNPRPITTAIEMSALDALKQMEDRERPLNVLPVTDNGKIVGLLRLHDLLRLR